MRLKHFYVVTYDISDTRRRDRVVKILEAVGHRVNYSVFECFLTDIQYRNMCNRLSPLVVGKDDQVNIYPILFGMLCTDSLHSSATTQRVDDGGRDIGCGVAMIFDLLGLKSFAKIRFCGSLLIMSGLAENGRNYAKEYFSQMAFSCRKSCRICEKEVFLQRKEA